MAALPEPTDREPTEELLNAARAGDTDAWRSLDDRYRSRLSMFLRGKIPRNARARFDTEDVLQSALLTAFKELDSYEYQGKGSFYRWMTHILLNRLHSRTRDAITDKRNVRLDVPLEDHPSGSTPSQLLATAESHARLVEAIADLPQRERQIVNLHFFDRMPLEQIARVLEVSPTHIRRLLARAVETIMRALN